MVVIAIGAAIKGGKKLYEEYKKDTERKSIITPIEGSVNAHDGGRPDWWQTRVAPPTESKDGLPPCIPRNSHAVGAWSRDVEPCPTPGSSSSSLSSSPSIDGDEDDVPLAIMPAPQKPVVDDASQSIHSSNCSTNHNNLMTAAATTAINQAVIPRNASKSADAASVATARVLPKSASRSADAASSSLTNNAKHSIRSTSVNQKSNCVDVIDFSDISADNHPTAGVVSQNNNTLMRRPSRRTRSENLHSLSVQQLSGAKKPATGSFDAALCAGTVSSTTTSGVRRVAARHNDAVAFAKAEISQQTQRLTAKLRVPSSTGNDNEDDDVVVETKTSAFVACATDTRKQQRHETNPSSSSSTTTGKHRSVPMSMALPNIPHPPLPSALLRTNTTRKRYSRPNPSSSYDQTTTTVAEQQQPTSAITTTSASDKKMTSCMYTEGAMKRTGGGRPTTSATANPKHRSTPMPNGHRLAPTPAQVGSMLPSPAQVGNMLPRLAPTPAQVGSMLPSPAQVGNMLPRLAPTPAQVGNMLPSPAQVGNMVPSPSQIASTLQTCLAAPGAMKRRTTARHITATSSSTTTQ